MEQRDGLVKRGRRIVGQQHLEPTEGAGGIIELLFRPCLLQGDGVLNKKVGTPVSAVFIDVVKRAVFGGHQIQGFTEGVAARRGDGAVQIAGYADHVFHQLHRFAEYVCVNSLEDISAGALLKLKEDGKGVVDMSASIGKNAHILAFKLKSLNNYRQEFIFDRFHLSPSQSLSG